MLGVALITKPARGLREHFVGAAVTHLSRQVTYLLPVSNFRADHGIYHRIDLIEGEASALLRFLHVFLVFFRPLIAGPEGEVLFRFRMPQLAMWLIFAPPILETKQ